MNEGKKKVTLKTAMASKKIQTKRSNTIMDSNDEIAEDNNKPSFYETEEDDKMKEKDQKITMMKKVSIEKNSIRKCY